MKGFPDRHSGQGPLNGIMVGSKRRRRRKECCKSKLRVKLGLGDQTLGIGRLEARMPQLFLFFFFFFFSFDKSRIRLQQGEAGGEGEGERREERGPRRGRKRRGTKTTLLDEMILKQQQ